MSYSAHRISAGLSYCFFSFSYISFFVLDCFHQFFSAHRIAQNILYLGTHDLPRRREKSVQYGINQLRHVLFVLYWELRILQIYDLSRPFVKFFGTFIGLSRSVSHSCPSMSSPVPPASESSVKVPSKSMVFLQQKNRRMNNQPPSSSQARLEYQDEGRGGTIYYVEDHIRFPMYWEFGGGNTLALIFIPEEQHWEKNTGLPLTRRDETLHFIGRRIVADKAGGRQYHIGYNCIEIR